VLVQISNAILLRFSRLLRNSPRPWVKHTHRPTTSDSLEKPHQKAKSSMSLQPHQNFIRYTSSDLHLTFYFFQFSTLLSRFSRGTMPALFRMAFSGIYKYPSRHFSWIIHGYVQEFPQKFRLFSYKHKLFSIL